MKRHIIMSLSVLSFVLIVLAFSAGILFFTGLLGGSAALNVSWWLLAAAPWPMVVAAIIISFD